MSSPPPPHFSFGAGGYHSGLQFMPKLSPLLLPKCGAPTIRGCIYRMLSKAGQAMIQVMANPHLESAWAVSPPPSRSVFPPHAHHLAEVNLVLQGTGILSIEDESYHLQPGSLIWIQPGLVHQLSDHGRDFRLHIAMMPDPGFPAPASACVQPSPEIIRRLDVLFCLLRDARDTAERDPAAKLLLHVARSALNEEEKTAIHHAGLAAALSELKRHPEASRSRLAQVAQVAPATLSRLIVASTGRTLLDLRREIRVERFLDLARDRSGTLLTHAIAAGYGSYSQCHQDCLRVTGHPPRVVAGLNGRHFASPDAKSKR